MAVAAQPPVASASFRPAVDYFASSTARRKKKPKISSKLSQVMIDASVGVGCIARSSITSEEEVDWCRKALAPQLAR